MIAGHQRDDPKYHTADGQRDQDRHQPDRHIESVAGCGGRRIVALWRRLGWWLGRIVGLRRLRLRRIVSRGRRLLCLRLRRIVSRRRRLLRLRRLVVRLLRWRRGRVGRRRCRWVYTAGGGLLGAIRAIVIGRGNFFSALRADPREHALASLYKCTARRGVSPGAGSRIPANENMRPAASWSRRKE